MPHGKTEADEMLALHRQLADVTAELAKYRRCLAARAERMEGRNVLMHDLIVGRAMPTATLADWRRIITVAESLHPYLTARRGRYVSPRALRAAYQAWLQSTGQPPPAWCATSADASAPPVPTESPDISPLPFVLGWSSSVI